MQQKWDDIPGSVTFPLKEATEVYGLEYPYFTSSVALMLTLAYLVGYKRVELYGFEMGTSTEYHYQRANGEFVIGFLMAKGLDIYVPPASQLLKGELYGYKNMKTGFRQNLEMRGVVVDKQQGEAITKFHKTQAQVELLEKIVANTEINLQDMYDKAVQEFDKARGQLNVIKGALAETHNLTGLYDM